MKRSAIVAADFPRERHAVRHRHAFERHERHDVHRADARMLAAMRAQIDVGDRALEQRQHRALDAGGVAGEREDRAVVRRVGGVIEQAHAVDRANRVGHRRDDLGPASFADVRHAFDDHTSRRFYRELTTDPIAAIGLLSRCTSDGRDAIIPPVSAP